MNEVTDAGVRPAAQMHGRMDNDTNLRPLLVPGEWDVFISYSRKDQAFATRLHAGLSAPDHHNVVANSQERVQYAIAHAFAIAEQ